MRCPYCGSAVEPFSDAAGTLWCPACGNTGKVQVPGAAPPALASPPPAAARETPGMATAALVFGIAAIVLFPLSIFLGPVALVLGIRALGKVKRSPPGTPGNGFAIGGIVMGAIAFMIGITIVLAAVVFVLVSNLDVEDPEFVFTVDAAGTGGTLTLENFTGQVGTWEDYEVVGTARCELPHGSIDVGDRITCVTDGDLELVDWYTGETVYATDV